MFNEAQFRGFQEADIRIKEWWLVPRQQKRQAPADSTIEPLVTKVAKMEWKDKAAWILQTATYWPLLVKLVLEKVHDKQCADLRTRKRASREPWVPPNDSAISDRPPQLDMVYPFAIALPDGPVS